MSRFGDDPHVFFQRVYSDVAPWDVGEVQPDMARLLVDYPPSGPVLDLGSATGDLAIHIATLGLEVVGLEFVETAVQQARDKAAKLPTDIASRLRFETGDATRPSRLGMDFGAVVDSGFLHLLDPDESDDFVNELASVLAPGGRYYLHEFAVEFPIPNVPRAITEQEVRSRFSSAAGWRVLDVREAVFHNRVTPTPAVAACVERL